MLENYKERFRTRGKYIFVPNDRCKRKGKRIIEFFNKRMDFPDYYYHYKKGGHVAALHGHLNNRLFFKIDIQNFYYSIARMRVTRALRSWGYPGAGTLAKWSCVANPIAAHPRHVLPIGFVQSPLLASLVLMKSPVTGAIERAIANGVTISVYLDDFVGSHSDEAVLLAAYTDIRDTCASSELVPNAAKLTPPAAAISAFNCDLSYGRAEVTPDRINRYLASTDRTVQSDAAFAQYVSRISARNVL